MQVIRAADKFTIIKKIHELYASKDALDELKLNFCKESEQSKENVRKNPISFDYPDDGDDPHIRSCKLDMSTLFANSQKCSFEKKEELERHLKELQSRVESIQQKQNKTNDSVLQSCSVLSRLLYQINPTVARCTSVTGGNILDVMTYIGLELDKVANMCHQENESIFKRFDQKEMEALEGESADWLRLHPPHKSSIAFIGHDS